MCTRSKSTKQIAINMEIDGNYVCIRSVKSTKGIWHHQLLFSFVLLFFRFSAKRCACLALYIYISAYIEKCTMSKRHWHATKCNIFATVSKIE